MSTLVKMLLDPAVLVFALAALAWLISFTPWRKGVRRLLFLCILILGLVYFGPLPALLSQPLAERFPAANYETLPEPDLIVVLGGMTTAQPAQEPGGAHPAFTRRSERFLMGVQLAHRFPNARLAFTGWSGDAAGVEGSEAARLATLAEALGVEPDRLLVEPLSQTTADHPRELAAHPDLENWQELQTFIVTSATHMPRAMGVFQRAGWDQASAIPTDFPFPPGTPLWSRANPAAKKTVIVQEALAEWVGLIQYYWRGDIGSLLPKP